MTRYIASLLFLVLVLFSFAPALLAGPRYARVVMGTRELPLSPRAIVENGTVYAPPNLLRAIEANYVVGEHKVTIADADGAAELDLSMRNGTPMIRLEDAAKALDADYSWNDAASTARLMARLVSVEFAGSTLTARLTLPASVSTARLWPEPWRLSLDLPGVRVATAARTLPVGGPDVSQVRIGQFNEATARIVVDLKRKLSYKVPSGAPSRELKIAVGKTAEAGANAPSVKPEPAPPVTVSSVVTEADGETGLKVRIGTSGRAAFSTRMFSDPVRIVIDIQNGSLDLPENEMPLEHALVKTIRAGQQDSVARIVLDANRYVVFAARLEGSDVVVSLELPIAAGGMLSEKVIVLDPGHGGYQCGAQAGGVQEKTLNLAIARHVRAILEDLGAQVIMTRDSDVAMDLPTRPAVADQNSADIFMSIHCNAVGIPDKMSGVETYYHPDQPSSRILARAVHGVLIRRTGMNDRRCRGRPGLAVLKYAKVPAILVECGYVDCSADRKLLCDDSFRTRFARALVEGLKEYVEGTTGTGGD